ncbi:MAG: glycoside hydrolase family 3 N-terminal domain-containing protein [Arachnia sp.]
MRSPLFPLVILALALTGSGVLSGCAAPPAAEQDASRSAEVPQQSATATTPLVEPPPSPTRPEGVDCRDLVAEMTLAEQVGQLYMVAVATTGLDAATAQAITETHTGSVVLLGNSTAGADAIAEVTGDVAALGTDAMPLLVAVDQEGGMVQRLQGPGFSDIPTALQQAELPAGELRDAARGWGEELAAVGVQYNLAPVADVVPETKQSSNAPIGALERNYGNDRDVTARGVTEFTEGMLKAGIASSLKHFPGLGKVATNTDFAAATDTDVVPGDEDWAAFTAGMEAGASSVMVSSALFTNLDPVNEALFSRVIIEDILRGELGFDKVVIADDLGAAVAVADVPAAQRGTRFIRAGGDLAINADPAVLESMVADTLAAAVAEEEFAAEVAESASRVLELKDTVGLLECTR